MTAFIRAFVVLGSLALGVQTANAATIYQYAGEWHVGEGPVWTSNPQVLNGLETAALLFGGAPTDYAISTVDANPANINFSAFVDGWGDGTALYTPVAQTYKVDGGNPGYNDPFGGPAYSAYVLDHSCGNRYDNPDMQCAEDELGRNFAFRIVSVPEPGSVLLVGAAIGAVMARRRRR